MALKRIRKQLSDHELYPIDGVMIDNNLILPTEEHPKYTLKAYIVGPKESVYQGALFKLMVELPRDYPFKAPKVRFLTKIYHPNINQQGYLSLCCMINPAAGGDWSPASRIQNVIITIRNLLLQLDADNPLNPEIALQYKVNRKQFDKKAAQWCRKFAM